MPFQDVCRTDRSHDLVWRQAFEDTIGGAVALCGFLE